jgi:uncharacterized membrane protein YjdF
MGFNYDMLDRVRSRVLFNREHIDKLDHYICGLVHNQVIDNIHNLIRIRVRDQVSSVILVALMHQTRNYIL